MSGHGGGQVGKLGKAAGGLRATHQLHLAEALNNREGADGGAFRQGLAVSQHALDDEVTPQI